MRHALRILAFLALFCVAARADTVDCFSFVADPSVYYAPPSVVTTVSNDPWPYFTTTFTNTFTVITTYTNNCSEFVQIGSSFGTDIDPMLADAPWAYGWKIFDFYDPSHEFAPGESQSYPFAYYAWSPDAPEGYTWTANISAEAYTEGLGSFWVTTQFTAIVTPEPGTLLLFGTGLFALAAKLRMARQKQP